MHTTMWLTVSLYVMLALTEAVPVHLRVKGDREMVIVQNTPSSGQAKMAESFPGALPG